MASPSSLSDWQFQCSVCLEVFTDPVSTPCGHSFCKVCLSEYWDSSGVRQCPLCKKIFKDPLDLSVNVILAQVTQDFKRRADAPEPCPELPGDVTCDVCPGAEQKLCPLCRASLCDDPVKSPSTENELASPAVVLADGACEKHNRPLELFCSTDGVCVCALCAEADHGTHSTVPIEREWAQRCSQLKTAVLEVKQDILDRQKKVEEVKQRVELSRRDAENELGEGLQVLDALLCSVEKGRVELKGVIERKQRAAEKRAEGLVEELEQEIGKLKRRNAELKQLLGTRDRAHVLQSFPSQHTPLCSKDWPNIIVHTDLCIGTVRSVFSPLEEDFGEKLRELTDAEFKKIQQYADDVTLDPITANLNLIVSENRKEVRYQKWEQNLPDNPERFDPVCNVLGKEMFTSGRHYWEVQVEGKTSWYLGVALESVKRKGSITPYPQNGLWLLHLKGGILKALGDSHVKLNLSTMPKKLGVYVDYEEGQISLYNVEARSSIFSFMGNTFTDKLSLLLNPQAVDSVPMIISPVTKAN